MKNIIFLLTTAFTVSIDSFLAGFSLSKKPNKRLVILGTLSVIFILCIIANYLGIVLENILTKDIASLGGIILIFVGIYDLITLKKPQTKNCTTFIECLITGIGVGLDGACANLSLSLMGINAFYVPVIIALMHLLMIYLGLLTSNTCLSKVTERYAFIPPIALILLGMYKIIPTIISFFA